jgi:hypothetical protein
MDKFTLREVCGGGYARNEDGDSFHILVHVNPTWTKFLHFDPCGD